MRSRCLACCFTLLLFPLAIACSNDSAGHNAYTTSDAAAAGSGSSSGADASGSAAMSGGTDAAPGGSTDDSPVGGGTPTSPMCDMNGRWLVAQRVLAQALGQTQASHNWFYFEVQQNADQVLVTKGLHCGFEVVAISSLGANVDSHLVWPALLTHDTDTGRKGTMTVSGTGCQLSIEKRYTVRGATVSHYMDPSTTMPTVSEQAMGTTPGWEDWDMDGNPGITLSITGAASGHLYCAQRDWNQFDGPVPASATKFSIPVTWDSGQDPLGYDPNGSSLVTQSAAPVTDPTQSYAWFVKLDGSQVPGDDTAICAEVRALVPMVAPQANQ